MRGIIFALVLLGMLSAIPTVTSETIGMGFHQIPDGTISRIDTRIEFEVENWGLERVFITLPGDWRVSDTPLLDGTHSFGGHSRILRPNPYHFWRLWGLPYEPDTPMGRGEIYTSKNIGDPIFDEVAGKQGWYIKPNERIKVVFDVKDISTTGGIIDPLKLERENPDIRVVRWYQIFIMNVSEQGFITAPWVVLGANLTEASPAPYSDITGKGISKYYEEFELAPTVPKWNRWITLSNPLSSMLISKALKATGLELPEIKKVKLVKPVFKVNDYRLIYYAYEWRRDRAIEGWVPWRNDFMDIPKWDEWF